MKPVMRPEEAKKLATMLESAELIHKTASYSLSWGMLTDEQRMAFTRVSNLAERMIQVMGEGPVPALTAGHAKNM